MATHAAESILAFFDHLDSCACEYLISLYQTQARDGGYSSWKTFALEKHCFADSPGTPLLGTTLDFQNSVWDLLETRYLERLEFRCRELKGLESMRCLLCEARPRGPGVTCAEQAIAAVHRFTQNQGAHLYAEATHCGGSAGVAFKVRVAGTNSTAATMYFVKVLSHERHMPDCDIRKHLSDASIAKAVETTALLGNSGLGPTVLGSDADAFVQIFVDGQELPPLCEIAATSPDVCLPIAQQIGRVIARMHCLPLKEDGVTSPHWTWWALLPEKIQTLPCKQREPLMALYDCIDTWPKDRGIGGMRVLSHGDLHQKNVLMLSPSCGSDGLSADLKLNVIDMELCGPHYRAFDLAFFIWHWNYKFHGGDDTYPDLAIRRLILQAYLQEAGFDSSADELDNMLWEVEFECLRITCWREMMFCQPDDKFVSAIDQLQVLLNAIKTDLVNSSKIKYQAITDGLLKYAHATPNSKLLAGADGGA